MKQKKTNFRTSCFEDRLKVEKLFIQLESKVDKMNVREIDLIGSLLEFYETKSFLTQKQINLLSDITSRVIQ